MKNKETKIQIVEDSPTQAVRLKNFLEQNGYRVEWAENGREGLSVVREFQPDLIICDVIMPEMGGYAFCREIKKDAETNGIPVILFTSLTNPEEIIKGLECGADNFLLKTTSLENLLARIRIILETQELRRCESGEDGVRIIFDGREYHLNNKAEQILDFLFTSYEMALLNNDELRKIQGQLKDFNKQLEVKVRDRTVSLKKEITERKEIERRLMEANNELQILSQQFWQTAKLATMGELTASIAHELNNPLQTVSLRVEMLQDQLTDDDSALKKLTVIEQELDRMATLVENLLQFSRRQVQQISTLNAAEEVEKTLELVDYHLRKRAIEVVREFSSDVPLIQADGSQLRQVFINLFTNAADAMGQGVLTLRLFNKAASDPEERIVVEVADTGSGIGREDLDRVIQPFFTTKPEGKGTGLGLAICRRIVDAHNGSLEIESTWGEGTLIRITLPVRWRSSRGEPAPATVVGEERISC